MLYISAFAALSSIAAVVFFLKWRDAVSRLNMPTLPETKKRKRKAGKS